MSAVRLACGHWPEEHRTSSGCGRARELGVFRRLFSPDGALFAYGRRDATVVVARNPFYMPACDPCDANCDGLLDQFDIEPFIACLFGP